MAVKKLLRGGQQPNGIGLKLLGGASVWRGGRPLGGVAAQRRNLALLAALAVANDRGLPRERLTALLWPERDEESARNSLKQALHVVRRELGPDVILGTSELRLNHDMVSCDLTEFERQVTEGRLKDAVDGYAGPFLDGFHLTGGSAEFEQWVAAGRARLGQQYGDVLESLATSAAAMGDQRAALRWWRQLAGLAPLDGRYARAIVETLLVLGDRPGALGQAEVYRTLLESELGVPLDAEMERLIASARASPEHHVPVSGGGDLLFTALAARDADPAMFAVAGTASPIAASPFRWRRPVIAGSAMFAALGVIAAWRVLPRPSLPPDPRRVAVVAVPGLTTTTTSLANAIARRLSQESVAAPVVLTRGEQSDTRATAQRIGAGLVISVSAAGASGSTDVYLTNTVTGTRLWGMTTDDASGRDTPDALADRVAAAVAVRLDPHLANWIGMASEPATLASYREFSRGLMLFLEMHSSEAVQRFRASSVADPSFDMASLFLAWATAFDGRWKEADSLVDRVRGHNLRPLDRAFAEYASVVLKGDLPAAYQASLALSAVSPASEWRYFQAKSALELGHARESVRILEEMGPDLGWLRSDLGYWMLLERGLHFGGEYERGLSVTIAARRRFPANRIMIQLQLKSLAALGRIAEVDRIVDEAMTLRQQSGWREIQPMDQTIAELRAHGHTDAARRLAARTLEWVDRQPAAVRTRLAYAVPGLLIDQGDLTEARRRLEQLVHANRDDVDSVELLAITCAMQGDRAAAARLEESIERVGPREADADGLVGRASVAASLGDRERAVRFLRDAYAQGFMWRNVVHTLLGMDKLRGYPPYEVLVQPVD